MNSKQINFFLVPEDLPKIVAFINENGGVIYNRDSATKEPARCNLLIKKDIYQVCVCREGQKKFLSVLFMENRNEFYIDILKSYCIEFSLGGFYPYSNKELHKGRFYYITKYYESDELVKKDEGFLTWAENVLKKFKKQILIKAKELSDDYMTENFSEWVKRTEARLSPDGSKYVIK